MFGEGAVQMMVADYFMSKQQLGLACLLAVLLSSRLGLGLEDPRGHLMKVLALDDKVLSLALA